MSLYQEQEHVAMLRDTVRRFVDKELPPEKVREWDAAEHFPRDVWTRLADLGVLGLTVATEHGGVGRDILASMVVVEELLKRGCVLGIPFTMAAHYAGINIGEVGSAEQKAQLLPKVVTGHMLFSYGFTEPDVGADIASVRTTARREGDAIIVNGAKRFCTGAAIANFIYTIVRSGPVEDRHRNLSIVLIPPDASGVTLRPQEVLGLRGPGTFDVSFDNVEIPAWNIVGGEAGWNTAWGMLAGSGLDVEKLANCFYPLANAMAAVEDAWAYAQQRQQFGVPICSFQAIRHTLAEAKTRLEACRLMAYNAAAKVQAGEPSALETSMGKLFIADTALDIVMKCQQVMGAYGYSKEFPMERYARDAMAYPIIGGSSAIQKNNIASLLRLPKR